MAKRRAVVTIGTLGLDRASSVPLYRQLYDGVREAILSGRLRPGARLPSTRVLAEDLATSRNTVLAAFDQLLAEGYLEGRVGAGTTVAGTLPETLLRARAGDGGSAAGRAAGPVSRARGALLVGTRATLSRGAATAHPFRPGLPGLDAFPFDLWTRLLARRWRRVPRQLLDYGEPAGYAPLREAIAAYLGEARGGELRGVAGDRGHRRAAGGRPRRASPARSRRHRVGRGPGLPGGARRAGGRGDPSRARSPRRGGARRSVAALVSPPARGSSTSRRPTSTRSA